MGDSPATETMMWIGNNWPEKKKIVHNIVLNENRLHEQRAKQDPASTPKGAHLGVLGFEVTPFTGIFSILAKPSRK